MSEIGPATFAPGSIGDVVDVNAVLARLVSFDTTSSKSNLPMISWIEDELSQAGFCTERIVDATGAKANLIASIGPSTGDGYVLSGHTDTVPVTNQNWSSNPHELRVRDGRAYGRGACDMKGFLAVCLALAPAMSRARLRRPIHLVFSYDEEVGCLGAKQLCAILKDRGFLASGCFVGEPTAMDIVNGHKSKRNLRVSVTGRACHSSISPSGVNAVQSGARLVAEIDRMAREIAATGVRDQGYDVPHTTLHVGVFEGGEALNVVPAKAELLFEIRAIPADDPDRILAAIKHFACTQIEPEMKRVDAGAGLSFHFSASTPGLDMDAGADVVRLAKRLAGRDGHRKVAFMTEAGLFQKMAGVPTVVVGPGHIDQAHTPDEWVSLEQLEHCAAFVRGLISHCAW
jgi:acetylornithine deacetylase